MSHLSVFRIFWKSFLSISNVIKVLSGEQEKESIIRVRMGMKNLFLAITDCHHLASLVMPIGDPQGGFFYPTIILMIDSYITKHKMS